MTLRNIAFIAARWTFLTSICRAVLQAVLLLAVARYLSPTDVGQLAVITTFLSFLLIISDIGLSTSVMSIDNDNRSYLSVIYMANIIFSVIVYASLYYFAVDIGSIIGDDGTGAPLRIAAISVLIASVGQLYKTILEKKLHFRSVSLIEIVSNTIGFFVAVSCLLSGMGIYGIISGYLVTSLLATFGYLYEGAKLWRPTLSFDFAAAQPTLARGIVYAVTALLFALSQSVDVIVVGAVLGTTQLGLYSLPRDLCFKILFMISPVISRVVLPLAARSQSDSKDMRALAQGAIEITATITFPVFAFIAFHHNQIVTILFGEKWIYSAQILSIIAVGTMFRLLVNPLGSLAYGAGKPKALVIQSFTGLVGITLFVMIGSGWGAIGASIGYTTFCFVNVFVAWLTIVRSVASISVTLYISTWFGPLAVAIISLLSSFLVIKMGLAVYLELILSLFLYSILYVSFMMGISKKNRNYIYDQVRYLYRLLGVRSDD
ncbi:MAG: oligosaccharide flippase family protein [Mesorhizobium sp.]